MEKLLNGINNIIKRYGKINTYHSLLIIFMLSIMGVFLKNQEIIVQTYLENAEKQHQAGLEYRQQIDPKINNIISKLLIDINATHVSLSELHNGESNAANGLPFYKFTMLYEEKGRDVKSVVKNYERINTSNYRILSKLFQGGILHYHVNDDLSNVDARLCFDLKSFNVKEIYLCPIYGVNKNLAFMAISYNDDINIDRSEIYTKIFIASQQISALYNGYKK